MRVGRIIKTWDLKEDGTERIFEVVVYNVLVRNSYSTNLNFANLLTIPEFDTVETIISCVDENFEIYFFNSNEEKIKFEITDFVVKECEEYVFKDVLNLFVNHKKFFGQKIEEKYIDKNVLDDTINTEVKVKRKYTKKVKTND